MGKIAKNGMGFYQGSQRDFKTEQALKEKRKRVKDVLQKLWDGGTIRGFLSTSETGFARNVKGIDFYVACVGKDKYRFCPFSINGARRYQKKHPLILPISLFDSENAIRRKILEAIRKR